MPRTAIISDVHSNLDALESVLQDISRRGIDEIWCLGDIVGYGPDPVACIELIRRNCSLVLDLGRLGAHASCSLATSD